MDKKIIEEKRIQVFPHPSSLVYLAATESGEIGPTCTRAIDVFAALIAHATLDNEKIFARGEWNMMADSCNGLMMIPSMSAGSQITANIHDSQALDGVGEKWFGDGEGKSKTNQLVKKLEALDDLHAWAVSWTIHFFWQRHENINATRDDWWTLEFRRKLASKSEVE